MFTLLKLIPNLLGAKVKIKFLYFHQIESEIKTTSYDQAIIEKLNKEFTIAINSPDVSQSLRKMNSEPFPMNQKETRELMISEIARWKAVIEKANIPLN